MQITDIIAQMGGLQAMARELGIGEAQAASGAAALAPAILGGLKKQAEAQSTGLDGLSGMLEQLGGSSLLDNVVGAQPTDVSRGNEILGRIFGSKEVSRAVAQNAAPQSGLDAAVLKKMLPMLAMLVAGYIAKRRPAAKAATSGSATGGGLLGRLVGGLLGGQEGSSAGRAEGGAGIASLLDLDGDGNPLDDILGMLGKERG